MTGTDQEVTISTTTKPKIFIASSSFDQSAQKVARELIKRGYCPILYEVDSVFDGSRAFSAHLNEKGVLALQYAATCFDSSAIVAAWYRHSSTLGSHQEKDPLRKFQMESNIRALQDGIFSVFSGRWLNDPYEMRRADGKIHQLAMAASVGLDIPETVVGNNYNEIRSIKSKKIIAKVPFNRLESSNGSKKLLFTAVLDNKKSALPLNVTPFPGIWQPYKEKRKEWRVTIVDEKVFAAAIYTTSEAKDDWRRHQFTKDKVEFRAEEFPESLKAKSILLLKKLGLRFGALDFIETEDGVVFLEVNPNGQYGWLEDTLNLPITDAIVDSLVEIAQSNKKSQHKQDSSSPTL